MTPETFATYVTRLLPGEDAYSLCLKAWMTAVHELSDFFPENYQVTTTHDGVNSRGSEYWFVCTPNTFTSSRLDGMNKVYQWQTLCDVYVRYTNEETSVGSLLAVRGAIQALADKLRPLPNINVNSISLVGQNLVQDIPGDNPNFIIQPLVVTFNQIVPR